MAGISRTVHDGEDDVPMWMCRFPPGEPGGWGQHYHRQHQIAWVAQGLSTAIVAEREWVVSPARAVWIPGGWPPDIVNREDAELYCLYVWPEHCRVDWAEPVELTVTTLARELLMCLGEPGLDTAVSEASATVLFAQFERGAHRSPTLPMPADERAAELARAILDQPSRPDTLGQWARQLATSESTLRRAFLAETGLTFTDWRTRARLEAALPMLADQWSVGQVAYRVGYASRSGFVDAFQRHFGHAPATYRDACANGEARPNLSADRSQLNAERYAQLSA